jgi:hypothetical protein
VDPALIAFIEKAGLLTYAGCMTWWALTLWKRVEARETKLEAITAACQQCAKEHSEKLIELGNGAVRAIEQSTAAIAASKRQEEIIHRLSDIMQHGSDSAADRRTGAAL